jgi:hypothetical protein
MVLLFTNNRKIGGFYNPRAFGTKLRMTNEVKYLGVILDKKLDWKAHLENWMRKDLGIITELSYALLVWWR